MVRWRALGDELGAAVVAGRVEPGRLEHGERAAGHAHGDDRGLDAAHVVGPRIVAAAAVGRHLDDLLAAHPAREVEVVDRGVEEDRRRLVRRSTRSARAA